MNIQLSTWLWMSLCSWPMKVLVVLILISNLYDKHDCIGNIMSSSYDMESVVCSHFSTAFRREPTWIASSLLWTYLIWMSLCPWPMIVLVVLILILYLYNKHDCIGNIMSSSYDDKESVVCSSLCLGGFWWWGGGGPFYCNGMSRTYERDPEDRGFESRPGLFFF